MRLCCICDGSDGRDIGPKSTRLTTCLRLFVLQRGVTSSTVQRVPDGAGRALMWWVSGTGAALCLCADMVPRLESFMISVRRAALQC